MPLPVFANYDPSGTGVLDPNNIENFLGYFTWAQRPNAATVPVRSRFCCTDVGVGGMSYWWSDGTNWRVMAPTDILFDTTPVVLGASASEQLAKSFLIQAGLLTSARYFSMKMLITKVGTTDSVNPKLRLGTAADLSGASIFSFGSLVGAANASGSVESLQFATSSTQVRRLGAQSGNAAWNGAGSNTAYPQNVTVSDMSTNPLYLVVSTQNSGATDQSGIAHFIVTLY